jgi:arsenate reductase (glutaredoxin)
MSIIVYGITNCSTVKKSLNWLNQNDLDYEFWDYKKKGIDIQHLKKWCNSKGWGKVLNRSGMMYRKATDEIKQKIIDQNSAINFMLTSPTSIKRPIIEFEDHIIVGFDESDYMKVLK